MGKPIQETVSTVAPLKEPESNFQPKLTSGKPSSILKIAQTVNSIEVIKALASIQDGLRRFVLAGGLQKVPYVNDKGILVIAIKLPNHILGIGPEGNFIVDNRSVMEVKNE